jgi:hypothetical protein
MSDHTGDAESAKVIPIDAAKARLASERKWGKKVLELGFCIVLRCCCAGSGGSA